jgi:hypothetical protein
MNLTPDQFHILSLCLTPFVYFSLFVVVLHYSSAAYRNRRPKTASDWLILGIVISMAFKVLDNGFWNSAWTAYMSGNERPWFVAGPIVNIFFRQLPIIAACACHWYAEYKTSGVVRWSKIITSAVGAVLLFTAMCIWGSADAAGSP